MNEPQGCEDITTVATRRDDARLQTVPNPNAYVTGPPIPERNSRSSTGNDDLPSIFREYHCSLLRFCAYTLVWTLAVIIGVAFLFMIS
jgi:hypothetical protein